jgi:ketosteroid isomerase-like protein
MRLILLVAVLLSTISGAMARHEKDPMDNCREAFLAAYNKGDAAALEKIFEPDGILLSFGAQVYKGGPMISKGLASSALALDLELMPVKTRRSGDMMYELGTWNHLAKGTKDIKQTGTYIWVWKKEKDGWRLETLSATAAQGVPIK